MEKEIVIENKENNSCKLILRLELDEDDEKLLKKRLNLLALSTKLNNEQSEILETLYYRQIPLSNLLFLTFKSSPILLNTLTVYLLLLFHHNLCLVQEDWT